MNLLLIRVLLVSLTAAFSVAVRCYECTYDSRQKISENGATCTQPFYASGMKFCHGDVCMIHWTTVNNASGSYELIVRGCGPKLSRVYEVFGQQNRCSELQGYEEKVIGLKFEAWCCTASSNATSFFVEGDSRPDALCLTYADHSNGRVTRP